MKSPMRKLSRRVLLRTPTGLRILLRMSKISKGDYYDVMSEFVMREILTTHSNCVDIGCHLGDILEPMIRFAPKGRFFAFEPLPILFQHLQGRFGEDQRITLYDIALSDVEGSALFQYVVDAPAYSGFHKTEASLSWNTVETIHVKTGRLDDLLADVNIDLVKVDVEGAEYQVLRGGLRTIQRCKPYVLFEHAEHAACYKTKSEDLFDLLTQECGLKISLLDDFLRGRQTLSRSDFIQQVKSECYFLAHGR